MPGELVEERDEEGEQDRHAQPPASRNAVTLRCSDEAARIASASASSSAAVAAGSISREHAQAGRAIALASDQPPRALRNAETHQRVDDRRERRDAEHPAPGILADAGEQRVGQQTRRRCRTRC